MNILYIVPNPPSLVRVRPYNLIKSLIARGHEVAIATTWTGEEEREDINILRGQGMRVLASPLGKMRRLHNLQFALRSGLPLQAAYALTPALARTLSVTLDGYGCRQPFDLVHVEHLRGAHYGLPLRSQIPVIWDSVDCISYLFEHAAVYSRNRLGRLVARLELNRTRRYEGWLVEQFDHVVVTSQVDKEALEGLNPAGQGVESKISVVPNGVDLRYFAAGEDPRDPATILFSGKLSYHANVTAAVRLVRDIMPLVWVDFPQARVVLAGKDPGTQLRKLAAEDPRVMLTGTVPDLRPYLSSATLAVSPLLYGAGIQNKVLEAMASATPVVASPPAVAALSAVHGEDLLVAGDDASFAAAIGRLLSDAELRRQIGAAGRRYVEREHNWDRMAERLENIYQDALARRSIGGYWPAMDASGMEVSSGMEAAV